MSASIEALKKMNDDELFQYFSQHAEYFKYNPDDGSGSTIDDEVASLMAQHQKEATSQS